MAKRTSSLLGRPFPSCSWRLAFAAPRFHQLIEAAVPLLSAAFGGLPGLPPLPTLPIALFAALRHAVLHCEHSLRLPLRALRACSSSLMAALQSNFHKQYAPTSAEPKKAAAQNHARALSSNRMQMAVTPALQKATMLAATSNPK